MKKKVSYLLSDDYHTLNLLQWGINVFFEHGKPMAYVHDVEEGLRALKQHYKKRVEGVESMQQADLLIATSTLDIERVKEVERRE